MTHDFFVLQKCQNFERMFTNNNMSHAMCHVSHVTCNMSHTICHMSQFFTFFFFLDKVVKFIGGGSVINLSCLVNSWPGIFFGDFESFFLLVAKPSNIKK